MKTMKDFKGTHGEFKREGTFVYSLVQDGWRKGEPLMVNDLHMQVYSNTPEKAEANARLFANSNRVLAELIHLVRLLEPLEKSGELNVPGLSTLNGAREAINDSL